MSVWYQGHRVHDGGPNVVARYDDTSAAPLDLRLDVCNHSPTGFEWGYGGSGPAQLALALCVDALDGDVTRAQRIYQHFKWSVVGLLDRETWRLSRDEVRATIERLEQDLRPPATEEEEIEQFMDAANRDLEQMIQDEEVAETETCLVHGTVHDARGLCPLCVADERERGTWER